MQTPASFKLDRRPYLVSLVRHTKPVGTMGSVVYFSRQIEIATHSGLNQRKFTREELADTFWHEVTHAILHEMGNKLWRSEKFVTEFSSRLTSAIVVWLSQDYIVATLKLTNWNVLQATAFTILASGGSSMWNSILSYLLSIKNLKQQDVVTGEKVGNADLAKGLPVSMPTIA